MKKPRRSFDKEFKQMAVNLCLTGKKRNDAGIGLVLVGDGKNNFAPLSLKQSGINIPYDTKKIKTLNIGQFRGFLAANNQGPLHFFRQY